MTQTQKQFSLNPVASEGQFPIGLTPPRKLPIWKVNLFTLYITLLAGLMVVSLPQRVFAQGKDMGQGYCSLHGNYTGASCPKCAAGGGTTGGSSASDQVVLDAAGQVGTAIGNAIHKQLFGDPATEQAAVQARVLAQQRAAEAAAAAEQKRQEDFTRLRGMLKLDNFDGDSGGGLLLKGVDVESDGGLARDSGGNLALKFGDDDLQPQVTRTGLSQLADEAKGEDLKDAPANKPTVRATPPAPNTDPLVRDTSIVATSGLPKSVEDAIAEDFSNAPAGVADALRKGYQAIMAHDMNTAHTCFKDALSKSPSDASLARLVDLTDYTLHREHEIAASQKSAAQGKEASLAVPAFDALTVSTGDGLGQLQKENAAYRQAHSDAPKIEYVPMPDMPEQPQTLTDQARELAKDARAKVEDSVNSKIKDKIPAYNTASELRDQYKEISATVGGIADKAGKSAVDQISSAAQNLGSQGNQSGLIDEHSAQLNQAGKDAHDTALKGAGDKAVSILSDK
jgi:hypothetical protein